MQISSIEQNRCVVLISMEEFTLSHQSLNYELSETPESFSYSSFFFSLTFIFFRKIAESYVYPSPSLLAFEHLMEPKCQDENKKMSIEIHIYC